MENLNNFEGRTFSIKINQSPKKTPNSFRLFRRPSTKSFPTSTSDNPSRTSLWVFKTAKELNRFSVIAARSQVFILRTMENERSAVADVEPFVNTSRIIIITLQIRRWCCGVDCKPLTISSKSKANQVLMR